MSVRRVTVAAVLLLFLTTVTACGGAGRAVRASPSKAPKPTAQARGLVLPFDAYGLSQSEAETVSTASDLLVRRCMRGRGHDWKLIRRPAAAGEAKNRRRYGVIETAVAERFGYHAPEQVLGPSPVQKAEAAREKDLSPRARAAALSSHGGCVEKANDRLGGVSDADYDRLNEIDAHLYEASRHTPRVAHAVDGWRRCMRARGFDYTAPDRATDDARWWSDKAAPPSRRERATATADVRCKAKTRLAGRWYAAEKSMEAERVAHEPKFFHRLAAAKAQNVRNAREVVRARHPAA